MEQGYIKLFRCIQDNELWQSEPFDRSRAWIDLLILANYKAGGFMLQGMHIKLARGEVGWSEKKLARRWKWSRGKVRRFIEHLKKEGQIEYRTVQADNRLKSLFTIINYEQYQGDGTSDGTSDGQAMDKRRDSNKKVKKEKKEKKTAYGEFKNIFLTDKEYRTLELEYPRKGMLNAIEEASSYCASKGKIYKNYLAFLRGWLKRAGIEKFEICTAKTPAPSNEPNWRHPDLRDGKIDGIEARRCIHCKKIFPKT